MDIDLIRKAFKPAISEIVETCSISEAFVDKELFQVYMTTVWGNAVLEPVKTGIEESDLPVLHDFLNEELEDIMGEGYGLTDCYSFLVSKDGEDAMTRLQLNSNHKEFIHYFARLILAELPGMPDA